MRAAVIDRYGGPDVLQIRDVPPPELGPDDLLVDVHAASVNPVDFKIREGKLKPVLKLQLPQILGSDLSGVVCAVGTRVSRFKVGDEIYARLEKNRMGGLAEQVALAEFTAALKPKNASHVEAASLPLVALTASQALLQIGRLQKGQRALIHAGAGGVGSFAIQLAKNVGAEVFTTASAKNHALVCSLGADVPIDYASQKFEEVARDCDVVLDTQGGDTLIRSFACVKPGGVLVSIGSIPDAITAEEMELGPMIKAGLWFMNRKFRALAKARGITYRYLFMKPDGVELARIAGLVEQGAIKPQVERTFPLDQVRDAFAAVESGRTRGKIVVQVR